jgi:DNA-binding transcriptional LysR family regulator
MGTTEKRFYYKQNRLKQLRAFCYATQSNSISKAAERLFLSQPSVSLQVKALENEMDLTLFERRGPRIELTPDGRVLYELASPLVEAIDNLAITFAERRGNIESGELNIAAGESTILYILPEFTQRFAKIHPGIQLRLHNVTGRDGLAQVRADEVDFAVGSILDFPNDISYQPIFTYDTMLITPLGHPLTKKKSVSLEDISPYGLILPPRHLSTWRAVNLVFQQHDVPYKVSLEAGGWEVIKRYVELGIGVSIVSGLCLTGQDQVAAMSLAKYFPKRSYGVVIRRGRFLSPEARLFIDMMHGREEPKEES